MDLFSMLGIKRNLLFDNTVLKTDRGDFYCIGTVLKPVFNSNSPKYTMFVVCTKEGLKLLHIKNVNKVYCLNSNVVINIKKAIKIKLNNCLKHT